MATNSCQVCYFLFCLLQPDGGGVRFARYQHHPEDIDNDLEELNLEDFNEETYDEESRYLRDDLDNEDVLNTKFVISEKEASIAIKLAELKAAAHFR